ncbi:GNAT family N-acetyltransferase [Gordonia oryzae]|uniref:GNAT family N-acetyltransferase n=1 Tax=Gordonia oryzae TaxID=2487349 RepID=UPI000F4DFB93|nr:GNAT family N-acetyltransferase [Gordonia oryzae]
MNEAPGGLIVETGIQATGFNQLHCDGGPQESDEAAIAAAERHFGSSGSWRIVSEGPSVAAEAFATRHGVERQPLYPVMAMPLAGSMPPPKTPLVLSTADDIAGLRLFVDCAGAGYRMDPALLKPLATNAALAEGDLRFHLGRLHGRCVAVSVSVRSGDTVGVYFVAVRRGFRRRGFATAVTWHAIHAGANPGAGTAVLQATPAGYPVYARMGFTRITDYWLWDLPGLHPRP